MRRALLAAAGLALAAGCGGGSRTGAATAGASDPGPSTGGGVPPSPAQDPGPEPPMTSAPFTVSVTYTDAAHRFLGVGPDGTAYAVALDGTSTLLASADGRGWTTRGAAPGGGSFTVLAALSTGTLLADVVGPGGNALARSGDGGASWTDVLPLGGYRMLTPHSVAELAGEAFFLEYQSFSPNDVAPITLWASRDDGQTWAARAVYQDHRHGHGLLADPWSGALWLFFGDLTGGTYVSLDRGATATLVRGPLDGGVVVDGVTTPGGCLAGMDALYAPLWPHVVAMSRDGAYAREAALPGPSYSMHRLSGGGYLAGAAREASGDVYPVGDDSAYLLASSDAATFREVLSWPRASATETARADVYWELPGGEAVVTFHGVAGLGPGGEGYALLAVHR